MIVDILHSPISIGVEKVLSRVSYFFPCSALARQDSGIVWYRHRHHFFIQVQVMTLDYFLLKVVLEDTSSSDMLQR